MLKEVDELKKLTDIAISRKPDATKEKEIKMTLSKRRRVLGWSLVSD